MELTGWHFALHHGGGGTIVYTLCEGIIDHQIRYSEVSIFLQVQHKALSLAALA